jgi:RNA polymerase sigma factor (sigma-70 family)
MATALRRSVRGLGRRSAARREEAGLRAGVLFDEFAPMVLAVCRYNLRDPQAAEDAAQETFLSAHRSLLGGTQPRDPAAWLATIARNECRRTGRTARPAPLDEDRTGTMLDPANIVAERAQLSEVAHAISGLPDRQREALVLREFCGLSYEQVAAAMSISGAAVDSLLSRARRRLVEQLGEIPRATHGTFLVPATLRDELARLIPGLDAAAASAGVGAGAGGVATLAGLGSAPVAAKVAATGAAAVALALPVQATLRGDEGPRARERPRAAAIAKEASAPPVATPPVRSVARVFAPAPVRRVRPRPTPRRPAPVKDDDREERDSSGPGPGSVESTSSGSGSSGSGSSGSGSSGSGSSGSGSSESDSSGSGSSGSGSSGSGSSGSGSSGSGSSGSGSSGSGPSGSGSSGSGSEDSSGSGSGDSGSGSSGSGSGDSGSGSGGSGDSGSGSTGSGSSGGGDD